MPVVPQVKQDEVMVTFKMAKKRPVGVDDKAVAVTAKDASAVRVAVPPKLDGSTVGCGKRMSLGWCRRNELHG